jgi:antitoxin Phd
MYIPYNQNVEGATMFKKITTADARKKFANIINQVAFGNDSFVLTRRGEPIAAIVSIKELKLLQDLEDHIDIEDAWKAKKEDGESIPWEELKKELEM